MKRYLLSFIGLVIIICLAAPAALYSQKESGAKQDKKKTESGKPEKGGYTIEETTELLKSNRIGKIRLDHDDHVYKCMKLAKEGKDLDGAVEALYSFKTNFGDTLDNEEVNLIIQISKLDTDLYNNIALASREIGKKKTTIEENFTIINAINKSSAQVLLNGIELAKQCRYKIDNDFFSPDRVELLVNIGSLKDTNRFLDIYESMKIVGMRSSINTRGLELVYKLTLLQGDVALKITEYLKVNNWKSRKQPGDREYEVIRDLMKGNYALFDKMNQESMKGASLPSDQDSDVKETKKKKKSNDGEKKAMKVSSNSSETRDKERARERARERERERERELAREQAPVNDSDEDLSGEAEKKVTSGRNVEENAKVKRKVNPCPCAAYNK